ncbi:MAG TPA: tetratricopeptide repeat protein [Gammaproteobacteria bacterium]
MVLLLAGCAAAPPAEKPAETQATHVSVPPPDPVLEAVRADYEIALTLLHSGELQDAVTMLREIVERAPQAVAPLANLALAQQRLGQLDEAAQSLAAAIVRHPEATLHNQLGVVQRQQGHFIEARRSYEAALALDSEFAPAHYNLAILCDLYLDDAPAALEHYRHYQRLTAQEEKSQVAGWIAELERRTRGAP